MDVIALIESINAILWGPVMLLFLVGTGVLFTLRLRFLQIRKLKLAFTETFGGLFSKRKAPDEDGISSFQALTTAIAAQVGTGNLAGVATAVAAGGPGAVFWMWVSGFFGMGTIFAEAILAQLHTERVDGEVTGGPAYYIKKGLGSPFLASFFAITIIVALGFMGNMVQSSSIAESVDMAFDIPNVVTGVVIAILVGLIIVGGIKRIASFTEKLVPVMAGFYIVGSLIIIIMHRENIIPAFQMIFHGAFNPTAATGGVIGVSIRESFRYGIARGLFSNEAGMGSTPHAHAVAKVKHPAQQGLVSFMGVVIDTGVVCTLTALVILTTGSFSSGLFGAQLTQEGFNIGFGNFGTTFIAICLFFFSLSTIISWYYFGEANVKYLAGKKGISFYRAAVLIFIVIGTTINAEVVWELADTFNALMIIPNLIALIGMVSLVIKVANDYESNFLHHKPSKYEK
ncbi:alanine or glycine:cation symporter, AGCS family [Pelagirhabdus alkalitolerans]|uniref:Alanine or glycine:cation symporter, AGCS family n=1 Tax=Pelagirhabdus alkalitolerans TaxID=1612202 RepID=A0A1G6GN13_9BACI|nr:sodium:alanine symporter family protein [Pelagirhabdus alkalitolerans]SDB83377.1 alanine or glycine:cation symporter, AGCS family [Pelagirhabdus alkalitolerans]